MEWRRASLSAIAAGRSPHACRAKNGLPCSSLPGIRAWAVRVLWNRTAPGRGGPRMEIAPMPTPFSSSALALLQAAFVAIVLPRVLSHGRVFFRGIKCPHRREDAIEEMIGLAWQWHLRLAEKGKDATCFPTALASYAA